MSSSSSPPDTDWSDILDQLREFDRLEFGRPCNASLTEYLHFLVEENVLPKSTADSVASLYLQCRFGGAPLRSHECQAVVDELGVALETLRGMDYQRRERLASRLRKRFMPRSLSPNFEGHIPTEQLPEEIPSGEFGPPAVPNCTVCNAHHQRRNRYWKVTCIAVAMLLWTLGILFVGHLQHEAIANLLQQVEIYSGIDGSMADWNGRIWNLRKAIPKSPQAYKRVDLLAQLAGEYARREEYAEAIFVYHQAVARAPQNAAILNELAWLLLTAGDSWYRDPIQAQALAERAYALQKTPAIMDTLAEACFQNGHYQRAVKLEQQAIAQETRNSEFFRQQLRKFRRASERNQTATSPRRTTRAAGEQFSP